MFFFVRRVFIFSLFSESWRDLSFFEKERRKTRKMIESIFRTIWEVVYYFCLLFEMRNQICYDVGFWLNEGGVNRAITNPFSPFFLPYFSRSLVLFPGQEAARFFFAVYGAPSEGVGTWLVSESRECARFNPPVGLTLMNLICI